MNINVGLFNYLNHAKKIRQSCELHRIVLENTCIYWDWIKMQNHSLITTQLVSRYNTSPETRLKYCPSIITALYWELSWLKERLVVILLTTMHLAVYQPLISCENVFLRHRFCSSNSNPEFYLLKSTMLAVILESNLERIIMVSITFYNSHSKILCRFRCLIRF